MRWYENDTFIIGSTHDLLSGSESNLKSVLHEGRFPIPEKSGLKQQSLGYLVFLSV